MDLSSHKLHWSELADSLQMTLNHIRASLERQQKQEWMGESTHFQGLIRDAYYCLDELKNYTEGQPPSPPTWIGLPSGGDTLTLELTLLGRSRVTLGGMNLELRPRFVELLCVLALHPEGLTGEQLALAVWGELADPACVKTEMSRLRQAVPLESRPYRLKVSVKADFLDMLLLLRNGDLAGAVQIYKGHLLPRSDAPEITETRVLLEESLRRAVLASNNPELIWMLAERLASDLELWEAALTGLPAQDSRRTLAQTQIDLLRTRWRNDPMLVNY